MIHACKRIACSREVVQLGSLSLSLSQHPDTSDQGPMGQGQHHTTGLWCKSQILTSFKLLRKKRRLEAFAYDSAVSHFFTGYTNFSVIINCATLALGSTSQWINTSSLSWRDWLEDYRADQEHWRRPFYEMGRWQRNQNKAASPPAFITEGISLCWASP